MTTGVPGRCFACLLRLLFSLKEKEGGIGGRARDEGVVGAGSRFGGIPSGRPLNCGRARVGQLNISWLSLPFPSLECQMQPNSRIGDYTMPILDSGSEYLLPNGH
jgi:hypothetical protein